MKVLITIGCAALVGMVATSDTRPKGLWRLDLVTLNGDTIFLSTDSTYSIHSLRKPYASSIAIESIAHRLQGARQTSIQFLNDTSMVMTKVRSGGRDYPNELDSGRYEMRHDSVLFTIRTRSDYQFSMVHDVKRELLYLTDGLPEYMVYQAYRKEQ